MKIYTRRGDNGFTSLIDSAKLPKDDRHLEVLGALDELNTLLGLVRSSLSEGGVSQILLVLQERILAISAELARLGKTRDWTQETIKIEETIDCFAVRLGPLRRFLVPGGSQAGAVLHLARAVCRRAERRLVSLGREEQLDPTLLAFLNRLSDLLFILARSVNQAARRPEPRWRLDTPH